MLKRILLIILLIIFADNQCFFIEKIKYQKATLSSEGVFDSSKTVHFARNVYGSNINIDKDRSFIKNSPDSILLIGCSYTYGTNLIPTQTFSYYLSNITNLSVYNFGIPGGCIVQPLYLSQNKNFFKDYSNVKLIIYTYIADHINRPNEYLKCEVYSPYCNFRVKKIKDHYEKMNEWYRFPSSFFIFRMALKTITEIKNSKIFYNRNVRNYAEMVNQTKRNLISIYPDAKFVFLYYYPSDRDDLSEFLDKDIFIVKTNDFFNKNLYKPKYMQNKDPHPTEQVWIDLVPALVKFLKDKNLL